MKKGCFLLIIICLFTLHACSSHKQNKTIAIDYYYWKKNFELDSFQKKIMLSTHSSHNYLRIFDVVWSEKRRMAVPVAVMKSKNELNENWQPAIYITNESLIQTPTLQIDSLAEKIVRLTNQMVFEKKMDTTELQLDCDWTVATKEKYFHLVNEIKKLTNKKISATIRLHQVKYKEKTGIPPVDIGVLMFYNIGKVEDLATQNSIFNQADAERYIYTLKDYPLPLKFALPIFAWGVHFSDRKIKQIIPIETAMKMKHSKDFYLAKKDGYKANKNIYLNGFYFKKNDEIRMEETNAAIVNKGIELIAKNTNADTLHCLLFDLSTKNIYNFNENDFEKMENRHW